VVSRCKTGLARKIGGQSTLAPLPALAKWRIACGMLLTPFLRQSSVKLLQPRYSSAFQIERRRGPWS
jgi:hypothetical protein